MASPTTRVQSRASLTLFRPYLPVLFVRPRKQKQRIPGTHESSTASLSLSYRFELVVETVELVPVLGYVSSVSSLCRRVKRTARVEGRPGATVTGSPEYTQCGRCPCRQHDNSYSTTTPRKAAHPSKHNKHRRHRQYSSHEFAEVNSYAGGGGETNIVGRTKNT